MIESEQANDPLLESESAEFLFGCLDLGLEAGKIADLVALEGDPVDDIGSLQRIELVMKEGVIAESQIAEIRV